jgi:hypothetical protein
MMPVLDGILIGAQQLPDHLIFLIHIWRIPFLTSGVTGGMWGLGLNGVY